MRHETTDTRFWLGSALVHTALVVLVLLSPAGEIVFRSEDRSTKPEVIRRGEDLAEVIEDIRDLTVERLKTKVALLDAGKDRMAQNFDTMNAYYQPFVEQQRATARVRFEQQSEEILMRMRSLVETCVAALRDPDASMDPLREAIHNHMARLLSNHEDIRRSIQLMTPEAEALLALQKQAADQQPQTNQLYRWILHEAGVVDRYQGTIKRAKTQIPALQDEIAQLEADIERLQSEQQAAAQREKELNPKLREARNHHRDRNRRLGGVSKKAEQAEQALAEVQAAEKVDEEALAAAKQAHEEAAAALAELTAEIEQAATTVTETEAALNEARQTARQRNDEHRQAKRTRDARKRTLDGLIRSRDNAIKSMPEHVDKRDYCIRSSARQQQEILAAIERVIAEFTAKLDAMEAEEAAIAP